MDESVTLNKKIKKNKLDRKQKKFLSKDTLSSKVNTLEVGTVEVMTKKEKADNTRHKTIVSTEVYSGVNIPDILVTPDQKHDATTHYKAAPATNRKFSGDNTSHDGDPIQDPPNYKELSEERRIRTKSLPQPPSHSAADGFASAPLPVDIAKEKDAATHELLNKRLSLVTKNDDLSALLSFHTLSFPTSSKSATKKLTKSIPTVTFSEPISLDSYAPEMPRPPVQIVDHQYINNSPRQTLQQRSKSVTDPPKTAFASPEEEPGYLTNLYHSVKNKFSNKNKLPSHNKGINEEDVVLSSHPQSQPQMLSQLKQSVALKQNANLPNKSNPESKHNVAHNQKKVSIESKVKIIEGAPGQKFVKLPHQAFVKPNEKNTTPPKHDNTLKLPNQKLPPTTNLNKPASKLAINYTKNTELEDVKTQLRKQQEQLDQLMGQQDKPQPIVTSYMQQHHMMPPHKPPSTGNSHLPSNKGSSLNTILQLVQATDRSAPNYHLNQNFVGANHDEPTDGANKFIYDQNDY